MALSKNVDAALRMFSSIEKVSTAYESLLTRNKSSYEYGVFKENLDNLRKMKQHLYQLALTERDLSRILAAGAKLVCELVQSVDEYVQRLRERLTALRH